MIDDVLDEPRAASLTSYCTRHSVNVLLTDKGSPGGSEKTILKLHRLSALEDDFELMRSEHGSFPSIWNEPDLIRFEITFIFTDFAT